jgi:hypothetical protein
MKPLNGAHRGSGATARFDGSKPNRSHGQAHDSGAHAQNPALAHGNPPAAYRSAAQQGHGRTARVHD